MKGKRTNRSRVRHKHKIILMGVGLAAIFWIIESSIHVLVFHEGGLFEQIVLPSPHELWMRSLMAGAIILFSVYAGITTTKRKRAEASLKSAESEREIILGSLAEHVIHEDREMRILWCNRAACESVGLGREELTGHHCYEVWQHRSEPCPDCPVVKAMETGKPHEGEKVTPDGRAWFIRGYPVRDAKGDVVGGIEVTLEVTHRKRAEEELKRKNEELENFVYTVSHELKSPIVTLQGFVSALEEDYKDKLDEKAKKHLGFIRDASGKMGVLIKDLLELSRVGRTVHQEEEVDFSAVVQESVKAVSSNIAERGIELVVAQGFPRVRCDKQRMTQVVENLLSNAVKFMGENPSPRIEIGHREENGLYQFWVKDNGIGIDPRYHGRIFELFQSLKEVTDEEGTGLGLTIARKIIQQHGGRIWVESAKGKGSTFYFTLPK